MPSLSILAQSIRRCLPGAEGTLSHLLALRSKPGTPTVTRIAEENAYPASFRYFQGDGFLEQWRSHHHGCPRTWWVHHENSPDTEQGGKVIPAVVTEYCVYLIIRIAICVIQALRIETCERLAGALAILANDILRVRRDVLEENLTHTFPGMSRRERRDLSRRMWCHLFLMICEIAHVPRKIHDTNWRKYIRYHRPRELVSHFLSQDPLVVVSGHFGNFEMASYGCGLMGFPTYAIARPLDNRFLHKFINQFRSSRGQFILPTEGSADAIQRVLNSGRILALLGDQHAGRKGCWVDFLGRPASCHKALAIFTLSGGAPMIVGYAKRAGRPLQFEIGLHAVADPKNLDPSLQGVKQLTQWYNHRLEELIREVPDQYWWIHRRWKGEPPRRRGSKSTVSPQTDKATKHAA